MKRKLINELWALLYQFICVPLLTLLSLWLYSHFIVVSTASGGVISIFVTVILVLLNIAAIYGIAYLMENKFKMPLIYHILTGVITIFALVWINVYFVTMTNSSCDGVSAIKCGELINDSKIVMTALIASITYFLLYIVIRRIVIKKALRSNK